MRMYADDSNGYYVGYQAGFDSTKDKYGWGWWLWKTGYIQNTDCKWTNSYYYMSSRFCCPELISAAKTFGNLVQAGTIYGVASDDVNQWAEVNANSSDESLKKGYLSKFFNQLDRIPDPSTFKYVGDSLHKTNKTVTSSFALSLSGSNGYLALAHSKQVNVMFLDGHCESLSKNKPNNYSGTFNTVDWP